MGLLKLFGRKNKKDKPEPPYFMKKYSDFWVYALFVVVGFIAVVIISSLYYTTVINQDKYAHQASEYQWRMITYTSQRGVIYDVNGNPMASNTYDYTVVCTPRLVLESPCLMGENPTMTREQIISDICAILGMNYADLDETIPTANTPADDPIMSIGGYDVLRNVSIEVGEELQAYIEANDISGFGLRVVPQRYYNYGRLASQVLGFANSPNGALEGRYGLELYYNDVLSGYNGYRYSEVDSRTDGVLPYSSPISSTSVDGNNIVLNIDVNIQRIVEDACRQAYDEYQPRDGVCAIVMNPNTGAIYAMVSLPDYDLNNPNAAPYGVLESDWRRMSQDERDTYLAANIYYNRCITDTYEPGSTFKALTTAIAFEENLTNENEEFSDAPIAVSEWHTISCWLTKNGGGHHGTESLVSAFQYSCNPIFVQLAQRIGKDKYYDYVHTFGFYERTGIDLPYEQIGQFHENPTIVDLSSLSFGESSTVTPIQLLNSYCAIINGGNLMVPHIVRYITDSDGNIVDEIEPEVIRTIFSEQTCARVRALMRAVVQDGTGSAGRVPGYAVAGKTSTSTIEVGPDTGAHVLSFTCFAPSDDPQIAVLVVLNKPLDNSIGSSRAAAVAAKIVERTLSYLGVPRVFTEDEYEEMQRRYYIQPVSGMTVSDAISAIGSSGGISTINGSVDMNQESIVEFTYPGIYDTLYSSGFVILYPAGTTESQMLTSTVPNLIGKNAAECIETLRDSNLNCHISGDVRGICTAQDIAYLETVYSGSIITVTLSNPEDEVPTEQVDEGVGSEDGYIPTESSETSEGDEET